MVDTPTADSPREPDISHVNPASEATWFGHPRQLARLFTTEMWERFGYYGMRALLTLYLTKHFVFGDRDGDRALWRLHRARLSDAARRRLSRRSVSRVEAIGEVRRDPDGDRLFHALLRRPDRQALCDDRRAALRGPDRSGHGRRNPICDRQGPASQDPGQPRCQRVAGRRRRIGRAVGRQGRAPAGRGSQPVLRDDPADRAVDGVGRQRLLQAQHLDHGRRTL